jgi:hypothetical protein
VNDTLTLDAGQLAPTGYTMNAVVDGRALKMTLSFNGQDAHQTGDLADKTYDLAADTKHFVVLDMGPFSGWFALPAQMQAWNDAPAVAIVPAMASGIPISPDSAAKTARPQSVPASDSAISVVTPMPFTLWFDPKTLLVDRLDFPTQGVSVVRQT